MKIKWALLLGAFIWISLHGAMAIQPGDRFPDLSAAGLEGAVPDLSGKVVLVDFWASWCAPCRQALPHLEALQKEFAAKGLAVIGINLDEDAAAMQKFLKSRPVSFSVARDAANRLVEQTGLETMPTSYLVGRDGKLVRIFEGFHEGKTEGEMRHAIEQALGP